MDIKDLKKQGYRVFVRHGRVFAGYDNPMSRKEAEDLNLRWSDTQPNGGETQVKIYLGNSLVSEGWAKCSSKDNFCKREGRKFAIYRALLNSMHRKSIDTNNVIVRSVY